MKTSRFRSGDWRLFILTTFLAALLFWALPVRAQTAEHLLNLNLGSGTKVGQAAIGNGANDSWNVIPVATNVAQTYTYYRACPQSGCFRGRLIGDWRPAAGKSGRWGQDEL